MLQKNDKAKMSTTIIIITHKKKCEKKKWEKNTKCKPPCNNRIATSLYMKKKYKKLWISAAIWTNYSEQTILNNKLSLQSTST